jgi:hypothetical protein
VSISNELKNTVVRERHNVPYFGHPGYPEIIAVVRIQYFYPGMKEEVGNYVARFLECKKVKTEHRHPTGMLEPFPNLEWK